MKDSFPAPVAIMFIVEYAARHIARQWVVCAAVTAKAYIRNTYQKHLQKADG